MTSLHTDSEPPADERDSGPRSPLRTVQVLQELAVSATGVQLAVLADRLQLPKTSLFRLLRSLESGGYVTSLNGVHQVGPETGREHRPDLAQGEGGGEIEGEAHAPNVSGTFPRSEATRDLAWYARSLAPLGKVP